MPPMACRAVPFLVISASLNPESNSRTLALAAEEAVRGTGRNAEFLDLRNPELAGLPICDGASAYTHPAVDGLNARIMGAEGILIAAPIYNYDVNAALKNLVELTGSSWEDQTVGFLCAAGGQASYMSVMAFANSLMLDFRCVIVPRFVYATSRDFGADGKPVPAIAKRVEELAAALVRLSAAKKE
ncbi:MAG TPA: NADPH-dependent FMN reductase [Opitutaceae bacterium]|nr:NADPH-dependent FMN reductase [Opitutaceae bacterium]